VWDFLYFLTHRKELQGTKLKLNPALCY